MTTQLSRIVFVLAIFAVGSAAPLARLVGEMSPISLGFGRVLIVGVLMAVWAGIPKMNGREWILTIFAAVCLAGHFWAWFASLESTTVLRSTVLVCLNPLWVGLWEWMRSGVFKPRFWGGTLISLVGALLMSMGSMEQSTLQVSSLFGDGLATLAGLLGSVYLIATKEVRGSVSVHAYTAAVCLFTALFLFTIGLIRGINVTSDVFIAPWVVLAMALGPQLFGHAGLTWCMERIEASTVALGLLLEPVGAALLAWWWFSEKPTVQETIGASVILIGLMIALRTKSTSEAH